MLANQASSTPPTTAASSDQRDAGRSWKALDLPWPEPGLADGVEALACLPE